MKKLSNVIKTRFDWLTCQEASTTEHGRLEQDIPKTAIPFPEAVGVAWYSSMHLPLNIVLRRASHHFKPEAAGRLFDLGLAREQYTEPSLVVIAARTGRFLIQDRRVGAEYISGPAGCLFQHTDALENGGKLDANDDVNVIAVIVGDSVLAELLGEAYATGLLEGLQVTGNPSASVNVVPGRVSAILYSSMPDHLTGKIGKLFAQAKVLEYLCALALHVNETKGASRPVSDRNQLVQHLHEELTQLEGRVPTLDELAQQYGMSARLLNDEFRHVYGCSIFAYVTEVRLKQAHAVLLNTDLPMKTLATNLGYAHVNHFISAFGRMFGYTPGSLRRKK